MALPRCVSGFSTDQGEGLNMNGKTTKSCLLPPHGTDIGTTQLHQRSGTVTSAAPSAGPSSAARTLPVLCQSLQRPPNQLRGAGSAVA